MREIVFIIWKNLNFANRIMDESTCVSLLQQHGIKPTSNRILVVKALASEEYPSSLSELCDRLVSVDKSGIFRSLVLFREHHLVHSLEDGDGGIRYELCFSHDDCNDEDNHVHFYCMRCHRMFCFYDLSVPEVQLPRGYSLESVNYVIKGVCPDCAKRK